MIEFSNIDHINSLGDTHSANCWGSTQFALSVIKEPEWQSEERMSAFLRSNTRKVLDRKVGDILVMKGNSGNLVHTAVYYGPGNNWWHKAGSRAAEFASFEQICQIYHWDYAKVEYRRLTNIRVKKKKFIIKKKQSKSFIMRMYRMFLKLSGIND